MNIESLPLVIFILLPGFLSWLIFCWGTVSRRVNQIQYIFISLLISLLSFTIAYYFVYLIKYICVNLFSASLNIAQFPQYMQILGNPEILPLELWIALYIIAIILGFILIALYRSEKFAKIFAKLGLDLYAAEDLWYRLFHHSDFVTLYLKDGNIIAGWPTYYSQTGEKNRAELYVTKIHYYHDNKWIEPDASVDGVLINTSSISRIEFRNPLLTHQTETEVNKINRIRWWHWFEYVARYFVWAFGLTLACITVIDVIGSLPERSAVLLLVALIIFMIAALVTWYFDVSRLFPRKRSR